MPSTKHTVLVVEDDAALAEALSDTLGLAGYEVRLVSDGEEAITVIEQGGIDMVVSDVHMKRMDGHSLLKQIKSRFADIPVILMTAYGSIEKAVEAMRDGAIDYLVKPFEAEVLVNMVGCNLASPSHDVRRMVGESVATRELSTLARRVAAKDVTVMITGESGTGKEVLAQYIHQNSTRADKAFIAINCAAIPENMLEATLFGYEKGAFTGAYKACPGKFELANGGTLLLDEISEMEAGLQSKLLRVLQERVVERLGGNRAIELDVRVLATSNRDMAAEVAAGRFREDLFYRLNVFPIHVQPLRERREDILPLAEFMLHKHADNNDGRVPALGGEAVEALLQHDWPGNVRELENVMQRAMVLCDGQKISAADLHFESTAIGRLREGGATTAESAREAAGEAGLNGDLRQREWQIIVDTLRQLRGSRKATAEKLGISQRTLRYKLARMREAGVSIPGEFDAQTA